MSALDLGNSPALRAILERGVGSAVAEALQRAKENSCNAFCALNPSAMDEARAAEARRSAGRPLSPLDGVPVAVKDNMLAAGMAATWGAELFRDFVPEADELPVARLRAAGAVVIGKTNTPSFSARGYTWNSLWGITRNPLDPRLTPGGSSGGMAAAIAAGIVPMGLGTDGGGSTRRPAAHCGIVGLKPSVGFIPRADGFLPLMQDLEVVGPMASDMTLLDALVSVMAGPDPRDPRSRLLEDDRPARALRIGVIDRFPGHPVDPGIRAATAATARRLEAMGHRVEAVAPFFDVDAIGALAGAMTDAGFAALAARYPMFDQLAPEEYRAQAENGRRLGAVGLVETLQSITEFRSLCGTWFADIDVLLMPAVAAQAWPVEKPFPDTIDDNQVGPRGHAVFTGWVNVAGIPALSLPSGMVADGLPVGIQFIAGRGRDRMLMALGMVYERALSA
ncbi:amidase [Celeribacter indicus]|uniref:Amidase n=1 Tax=Celeribacter indicus TaxID=1208324 RepID=A0A0B5DXY8_9RHOB|nr:amidase [Celeribacter indicus]AJE47859.1 amidase [Celeribacter indicus]SDW25163.1 aspartyl-tRNA(Asn)/glutamyl-tRNA(Gln) amidotransferase subunit A [Celeribacter indicus]